MGFRFFRRMRIAPGISLNFSKSGTSLSVGPRGAKMTIGPRGTRVTVGIPGTGLYYTATASARAPRSTPSLPIAPPPPLERRLTLGFFKRLVTSPEEREWAEGARELVRGDEMLALDHLRQATHLADGCFLAGLIAFKRQQFEEAAGHLEAADKMLGELGKLFAKYGLSVLLKMEVTDEYMVQVGPDEHGLLLLLAEVYQRQKRYPEALAALTRLRELAPQDVVVKLSLAELLLESRPGDKAACDKVIKLAEGVANEGPVHAALLLYKARALLGLAMPSAALNVLSAALRRTAGRPEELLRALRYERALAFEAVGQAARARADLEKLYADAPDYADVAKRLGVAG